MAVRPRKYRKPKGNYLEHRSKSRVRFQEVDQLGIVWHGHYLSFFEDARVALGLRYGISYHDVIEAGLLTPVVHLFCDYIRPAKFDDELEILARLYERESAKLEFYYEVWRPADGELLATGVTVQAFSDLDGSLRLTMPQFMRDFYVRNEANMVLGDD